MMNKKHGINLNQGVVVKGKWNKHDYEIKRKLGSGTVGTVYLCESEGHPYALKISEQSSSLIIEVNVLKALNKVQGVNLGPSLIDVDDFQMGDQTYTFYVMEYLRGVPLTDFIRNNGHEWIGVFMLQLLGDLEKLHQSGWVFGDLKVENLLVVSGPIRIRWVDVGGTTQIGRAIKEYTEFYDRGYWGLGSRKAEPSYDLFSLAMVFLSAFYPQTFPRDGDSKQTINKKIDEIKALKPYRHLLQKAINGEYYSSTEMKQDLISVLYNHQERKSVKQERDYIPFFIESGGLFIVSLMYFIFSRMFF